MSIFCNSMISLLWPQIVTVAQHIFNDIHILKLNSSLCFGRRSLRSLNTLLIVPIVQNTNSLLCFGRRLLRSLNKPTTIAMLVTSNNLLCIGRGQLRSLNTSFLSLSPFLSLFRKFLTHSLSPRGKSLQKPTFHFYRFQPPVKFVGRRESGAAATKEKPGRFLIHESTQVPHESSSKFSCPHILECLSLFILSILIMHY